MRKRRVNPAAVARSVARAIPLTPRAPSADAIYDNLLNALANGSYERALATGQACLRMLEAWDGTLPELLDVPRDIVVGQRGD